MGTYNIDTNQLENAISPKTKAIFIAHTLGNPFDVDKVMEFANKHNLWVIEDCCDAVGATVNGKKVGTFGHIATVSYYPAHHMTMGEGGAVLTNLSKLFVIARSFRDWGRDCWCEPGKDNTCGKRFTGNHGNLPYGYDHKYVYSHLGYNMKITDMQAAIGLAQLDKLDSFISARRRNFDELFSFFKQYENYFILPKVLENHNPSWFGFPLTVKENDLFDRNRIVTYLEDNKIGTRLLFAGNMTKQPAFEGVTFRQIGEMVNTDNVMKSTFMIGVFPGISKKEIEKIFWVFNEFFKSIETQK
jgi:CDP-6-deoxy-D-xylo-4-hexulose-3-dehydrase